MEILPDEGNLLGEGEEKGVMVLTKGYREQNLP